MATLVIGDGNFSFSLALARKVGSECTDRIVATSLETEQEVSERSMAQENVSKLRKLGVYILHGIDGTRLETEPQLLALGLQYSTIIFNFPHTGGKSNIKRNRQLLRDFFASAKSVMSPRGCARVTLSRGQGGTPAESTQRGYHNSWRAVEIAAEAGLILSHMHPFDPSSYPGYVSTGYRGACKGFVLDGALEHTFTLPLLDDRSWRRKDEDTFYDTCQYCCDGVSGLKVHLQTTGLREFLHCPLLSLPWHPVTRTHRVLLRTLQQLEQGLWGCVRSEVREKVTVHHVPSLCCPSSCEEDVQWQVNMEDRRVPGTRPSFTESDNTELAHPGTESTYNAGPALPDCRASRDSGTNAEVVGEEVYRQTLMFQSSPHQLLPSLLDRTCSGYQVTAAPALLTVTCSTVRETVISLHPSLQPISHWLCGVLPLSSSSEPHTMLLSLRHTVLQALRAIFPNTSLLSSSCGDIVVSVAGEMTTLVEFQSHTHRQSLTGPQRGGVVTGSGQEVNHGGVAAGSGQEVTHLVFTVHLDTLAVVSHGIPHINLLWSRDRRFVEQFRGRDDSELITFLPFSLFPPHYCHDISFWVPSQLSSSRDESLVRVEMDREMRRAVRCVAGMRVVGVTHVDTYRSEWAVGERGGEEVERGGGEGEGEEVKSGCGKVERVSMCYRVEYSSLGEALSRSSARELQLRVRERLASQVEGLELR